MHTLTHYNIWAVDTEHELCPRLLHHEWRARRRTVEHTLSHLRKRAGDSRFCYYVVKKSRMKK